MEAALTYETITAETDAHGTSGVTLLTINRPQVGNAVNTQMGHDLLDLWNRLTADAGDIRCIVLTGAGEKIFCAGGDLKERNGMTKKQWTLQHELFERMYWTLVDLPVPPFSLANTIWCADALCVVISIVFPAPSAQRSNVRVQHGESVATPPVVIAACP